MFRKWLWWNHADAVVADAVVVFQIYKLSLEICTSILEPIILIIRGRFTRTTS